MSLPARSECCGPTDTERPQGRPAARSDRRDKAGEDEATITSTGIVTRSARLPSWALVLPIRTEAAALFYQRLFALDPQLRPLFKRDIAQQGAMLMATLNSVVGNLDRLDQVLPTAQQLALRHVGYGVRPAHCDTVGEALLWTLRTGLGAAASDEVMAAWAQADTTLAGAMKDAAYPPAPALPARVTGIAATAPSPAAEWQAQALVRVPA